jgi:hypothetical protein
VFSSRRFFAVAFFLVLPLLCSAQTSLPASWVYSTYFGGSQFDGIGAITRDADGNIYATGTSASPDFPTTPGVYEANYPGPSGDSAVFVAKFSPDGALVWSTFLGPGSYEEYTIASAIQVDAHGNVYIAGIFQTPGFPTTKGLPDDGSVFIAKLNATGSELVYSMQVGPNAILSAPQLVLDSSANAFVTGSGEVPDCCNSVETGVIGSLGGGDDFWVEEINAAGTALPWSVQIGGDGEDDLNGFAIDAQNKLYLTGYTESNNFPHTPGALNQPGEGRTFVVKLDPTRAPGLSLVYSALVGNAGHAVGDYIEGRSIVVDGSGNSYVGTWTYNVGLFTGEWAFQPTAPTVPLGYVFELNNLGSSMINGSYVGGTVSYVDQVQVDQDGNIYIAGSTDSLGFIATAYDDPAGGGGGYYVKLNRNFAAISSVAFSGVGGATAIDARGGLWVAGNTGGQLPTTPDAFQPLYQGNSDGFLLHTDFLGLCPSDGIEICSISPDQTAPELIQFVAQASEPEQAVNAALSIDDMAVYGEPAAQFDTWLGVAPGRHIATASSQNTAGKKFSNRQGFLVLPSAACPVSPLSPSLTFCSPLTAAVIQGLVSIEIQANDYAPPPGSVILYVDGNLQTRIKGQNGTYSFTFGLPPGIHSFAAKGEDGWGNYLTASTVARVE